MVIDGKAFCVLILQESSNVMADLGLNPGFVKPNFDYGEHSVAIPAPVNDIVEASSGIPTSMK